MVMLFDKTVRTAIDLALAKGVGNPFPVESLERIEEQNLSFLKPRIDIPKFNFTGLSLIPLAIIAFMVLKKWVVSLTRA